MNCDRQRPKDSSVCTLAWQRGRNDTDLGTSSREWGRPSGEDDGVKRGRGQRQGAQLEMGRADKCFREGPGRLAAGSAGGAGRVGRSRSCCVPRRMRQSCMHACRVRFVGRSGTTHTFIWDVISKGYRYKTVGRAAWAARCCCGVDPQPAPLSKRRLLLPARQTVAAVPCYAAAAALRPWRRWTPPWTPSAPHRAHHASATQQESSINIS